MKADRELSEQKTVKRFVRREERLSKDGYGATQEFAAWSAPEIAKLSDFIRKQLCAPPDSFAVAFKDADPDKLAAATLMALTHAIIVEKDGQDVLEDVGYAAYRELFAAGLLKTSRKQHAAIARMTNPYERRLAVERAGWRARDWSRPRNCIGGAWFVHCALIALPEWFVLRGCEVDIREEAREAVAALREKLPWQNPVIVPMTSPPKPWTGWRDGGFWSESSLLSIPFVKSHHPGTEKAIRVAFADGSMAQHVDAINSLQAVPWRINEPVLGAVKQYAGKLRDMGRLKESNFIVTEDIDTARRLEGAPFWTPQNIDFRGRAFPIPYFSHIRSDHVRGLFTFDRGLPIGTEQAVLRLMDHTAARYGEDKGTLDDRRLWVRANKEMIERTARLETDKWLDADDPFQFLAACIELTAAWRDGPGFVTHLPLAFDGKCNAIQHQCAMLRAEEGAKVNLTASAMVNDVYEDVAARTRSISHLASLISPDIEIDRGLVKQPVMTTGYDVTSSGMQRQIADELEDRGKKPKWSAALEDRLRRARWRLGVWVLSKYISNAIDMELPRCKEVREFLKSIAGALAEKGVILHWTTPTGLPWANLYYEFKTEQIDLALDGRRVRRTVADGFEPGIRGPKAVQAVTANVTHAMDAAHMVRTVNASVAEGITNLMMIHDSFGCLAPQAERFNEIIREEFLRLYEEHDPLTEIRESALCTLGELPPVPKRGTLDLRDILKSTYAFT